jgi:hypothetical protein
VAAGNLEEECAQAFAEARAEAKGYTSAEGPGLALRLDAIENAVLNLARAVDNAWARLANDPKS